MVFVLGSRKFRSGYYSAVELGILSKPGMCCILLMGGSRFVSQKLEERNEKVDTAISFWVAVGL